MILDAPLAAPDRRRRLSASAQIPAIGGFDRPGRPRRRRRIADVAHSPMPFGGWNRRRMARPPPYPAAGDALY
jgi:hypothetical protein